MGVIRGDFEKGANSTIYGRLTDSRADVQWLMRLAVVASYSHGAKDEL